ncbi:hypothetical protein [Bosea minatitlanensis]|uniref:Uncharacterized protein n=1 Tax=Bosea minatitlanensis TaxID=128782 RepID=A0ABW0F090_9HYPH|nr:hypothetical protein [Bosea minatitlanensis]MCT4492636.1 hypothetical protein [Bosea minatitlanensis]
MAAPIGVDPCDGLDCLRDGVLKAGVLNAKALQAGAESHVAKLAGRLPPSSALDEACFQVVTDVIAFARLLYGQAQIAESESARRKALTSIDRLATLAATAGPTGSTAAGPAPEAILQRVPDHAPAGL